MKIDSNNNREQNSETMNYSELCLFVKEKKSSWMRTADRIKEISLKNNFSLDSGVISEHFHETTGLFDDLFRDIKVVTKELKRQFKTKQERIVAVVKEEQPENPNDESPKVKAIKNEINDLAMLAQAVSEEIADMLAELFDLLKDSALNAHITNSIFSEYGIELNISDPIHLTRPALKSSVYREIRPITTQRLIPRRSNEDKSGITTYEKILQQAMLGARQSRVSLAEIDPKVEGDQEETTRVNNRPGFENSTNKPGTRTINPGRINPNSTNSDLKDADNLSAKPTIQTNEPASFIEKRTSASTPKPKTQQDGTVQSSEKDIAGENQTQTVSEFSKDPNAPEPEIDSEITENPFRVKKSIRRKLWTTLGAGAAVIAAGLIGHSAVNNCSQDDLNVSVATTTADKESKNEKTTADSEKPTQTIEEEAASPVKYTVNTDHADYARYLQNFKGMHAFQADLNYAAGSTEVELNGNETTNELRLKVLREFLEAGIKTATSAFSQKAFSMYLNSLDRLEKEIKEGIASLDDENLMEDGSYRQIRIMAEGIKNIVRTVPPENIAGYKITTAACHPFEVFTHNYLDKGGAPAFHTTVVKTLENIEEDPFKRGDSGYVTTEFFKRLHRQAAVQKAQNKVDGSPAVAGSIERYIRSGGNNSISDMLRACVVPIYRTDIKSTPEPEIENTVAPSKGGAIPINYVPEPSPTGLFDLDKLDELDSGWYLPGENAPEIEVTGEEYVNLEELMEDDTPEIEVTEEEYVDPEQLLIEDDTPQIEITGEKCVELNEDNLQEDDSPEIEITGEEYVELTEEDLFFNEKPFVQTKNKVKVSEQEQPPVKQPPVKKSWFSRAAAKVKSFFA